MRWFCVVLAIAACRGSQVPDMAPRHVSFEESPLKRAPVVIAAPTALAWTKVASGEIAPLVIPYGDTGKPMLARHSHGGYFAALVNEGGFSVRVVRAVPNATVIDIPLAIEKTTGWSSASIVVGERDVNVVILGSVVITAAIDLGTMKVTRLTRVETERRDDWIEYAGRMPKGWLLVGYRAGRNSDAIAWSLADDASSLGAPEVLAAGEESELYPYVHTIGDVAPNGTAFVLASKPKGSMVGATFRDGRWTVLGGPFPMRPGAVARGSSKWLVTRLADAVMPIVYAIDPVTATATALDASWSGIGRRHERLFSFGDEVVVYGGDASVRTPEGLALNSGTAFIDGAIYDLARSTVRTFPAPVFEELGKASWDPALVLPIGERLCLSGGHAYSQLLGRGGRVHGAACLDRSTLVWTWLASQELPKASCKDCFFRCAALGAVDATSHLVHCDRQEVYRDHHRNSFAGPFEWSLWLLQITRP